MTYGMAGKGGAIRRSMTRALMLALTCALLHTPAQAAPDAADLETAIAADMDHVRSLYIHLHRNPELSFQEVETARRMAMELESLGFAVTSGVGGHGVVAVLENGPGPTVMLRADMDALPVKEQTGLDYASVATGVEQTGEAVSVMHACGHDAHMAIWVGAARQLAARRDAWSGTLVMIAQPAEERGAGARAMLEDGLFERFPRPDHVLALHMAADLPAGQVGVISGFTMANVDSVDVTVRGVGGHGAYPHTTKDPVVLASQIVLALQTLVSREVDPQQPAVVTVGAFQAGSKHNVISDEARLQLTVRSYTDEVRAQLLAGIERIAAGLARAAGVPEDRLPIVEVKDEFTPSTFNTKAQTERLEAVWRRLLGPDRVVQRPPVMGGEDFSRYHRADRRIESTLFWLGAVEPGRHAKARETGRVLPSLHSPFFAPDIDRALPTGVLAMTGAALDLLGAATPPTTAAPAN